MPEKFPANAQFSRLHSLMLHACNMIGLFNPLTLLNKFKWLRYRHHCRHQFHTLWLWKSGQLCGPKIPGGVQFRHESSDRFQTLALLAITLRRPRIESGAGVSCCAFVPVQLFGRKLQSELAPEKPH